MGKTCPSIRDPSALRVPKYFGGVDEILLEFGVCGLLRVPVQATLIQFKVAPCLAQVEKNNLM